MRELIAVTEADIEAGIPSCPYLCPVAHALRRQHPGSFPGVGRFNMTLQPQEGPLADRLVSATPSVRLERWIRRFDLGKPVQPTRFAVSWEE